MDVDPMVDRAELVAYLLEREQFINEVQRNSGSGLSQAIGIAVAQVFGKLARGLETGEIPPKR